MCERLSYELVHATAVLGVRKLFCSPSCSSNPLCCFLWRQENLKQPQAYQKTAYYPTTYSVHVDQQTKDYVIALTGLTKHDAS